MNRRMLLFVLGGLAVALALAVGVSRYASTQPDGLSKVATDEGLDGEQVDHALDEGPLAGYSTRGVDDQGMSKGLAGVVGVGVTFLVAGGAVRLATRGRPTPTRAEQPATVAS